MKSYRVVIVDDEEPARELLNAYCDKIGNLEVVGMVGHALEAKKIIENKKVDILFSDIQMDDLTGIDLIKLLKHPPVTIFTTAYSEYALEGYNLDVIDYLVKPISFQRFFHAIEKAIELISFKKEEPSPSDEKPAEYVFVKTNRKMVKVVFDEVLFVESYGEYVKIHTQNDMVLALQTMTNVETIFPNDKFVRIHRSHLVNLNKISAIEGNRVSIATHKLTVSKRLKEQFMKRIKQRGIL
nr:LytTR family DNA-binding domain-containing protein [Allomuricauda sp.]